MASKKVLKGELEAANEAAKYWLARYHEDTDEISGYLKRINDLTVERDKAVDLATDLAAMALQWGGEADEFENKFNKQVTEIKYLKENLSTTDEQRKHWIKELSKQEALTTEWRLRFKQIAGLDEYNKANDEIFEALTEKPETW